jgi:nitrite reductase/ring-hydroxylating ferredoxin subunit/Fe-S cluster biogenesis protein NfuA
MTDTARAADTTPATDTARATDTTRASDRGAEAVVDDPAFTDLAAAVDAAVTRTQALDGEGAEAAADLRAALEAFHRSGLVTIVRRLRDDPRGKELLFELVDDPGVRAMLALHGIIRADPATRANQALDSVRPYLQSHGGDVELVRVVGSVAEVRLLGACNGCSMSAATLRDGVEQALIEHVDEIETVEVLDDEPTPAFIPIDSITRRDRADGDGPGPAAAQAERGWGAGPAVDDVQPGRLTHFEVGDEALVATNTDGRLAVFRNACVHQGLSLDGGSLEDGVITCPWHGFTFEADTGECLSSPGARLSQLPARVEDGRLWVRADGT